MPILSIDHVQIAIPIASENRARAFYSGILGFTEVAKPPQMAERKSIWFIAGAVNLHLGIEPDFTPAKRAHPALIVEGLDTILAACERAAISAKPDTLSVHVAGARYSASEPCRVPKKNLAVRRMYTPPRVPHLVHGGCKCQPNSSNYPTPSRKPPPPPAA